MFQNATRMRGAYAVQQWVNIHQLNKHNILRRNILYSHVYTVFNRITIVWYITHTFHTCIPTYDTVCIIYVYILCAPWCTFSQTRRYTVVRVIYYIPTGWSAFNSTLVIFFKKKKKPIDVYRLKTLKKQWFFFFNTAYMFHIPTQNINRSVLIKYKN